MTRILRVITRPNVGGPMRQAVALWHAHAALGARTLLVTGRCRADEAALPLAELGIPLLSLADALQRGREASGICVVPTLGRRLAPLADLAALRTLRRLLTAFHPDVLHSHTSKAGWLARLAARGARETIVAHTFHGLVLADYVGPWRSRALCALERRFAARSDLLIAVSASCRDELEALRVAYDVRVVPPAVALEDFARAERSAARHDLGLDEGTLVLGFLGRMVDIKRPELFAALLAELPDAVGIAAGDGPRAAVLRAAATRLDGRLRVLPTSAAPAALVAALDLLVLPSRREGFPIVGVEATAAGVPTLGFDVPGLRDLAEACPATRLVAEGEGVRGLAESVREFVRAGRPRVGPGAAALAAACAPRAVAARLLEEYAAARARRATRGLPDRARGAP